MVTLNRGMEKMIRITFFIFGFLLCSHFAVAQYRAPAPYPPSHLEVNSDYKLCLLFLKNYETGQKTEAIYDTAEELGGKMLVSKDGFYGLVNDDLTYLIPLDYQQIELIFSVNDFFWKAKKNGKVTLFDFSGKERIPPLYDEIDLDFDLNPYSSLHNYEFYNGFIASSPNYFRVINNGKVGIIALNGDFLFPLEYDKIEVFEYVQNPYIKAISSFFWVVEKDSTREVLTFAKEHIYSDTIRSFPTSVQFISRLDNPYGYSNSSPILLLSDHAKGWYRLLHLETRGFTKQAYYNPGFSSQDIIMGYTNKNSKECVYLSDELEPLLKSETAAIVSKWRFKQMHYVIYDNGVGTIDYMGEPLIPLIYKEISVRFDRGKTYLWAEQKDAFSSKTGKLLESKFDIYDEDLKLIRTIQLESILLFRQKLYSLRATPRSTFLTNESAYLGALIIAKKDDKYGALNAKGEVIIPFIYEYEPQPFKYGRESNETGFLLKKNDKYGIVNQENKIVYPFEYEAIDENWKHLHLQYFYKNGHSTLMDEEHHVFIENADSVILGNFYHLPTGLTFKDKTIRPEYRLIFAVKNDSLYTSIASDPFQLCDSSVLEFNKETLVLSPYLVYKSGYVRRLKTEGKFEKCPNYLLEIHKDTACLLSLAGDFLANIPDFSTARIVDEYLLVQLNNKRVGLRSKDGLSWLVQPNYQEVILDQNSTRFWVKLWETKGYSSTKDMKGKWILINEKGENQLNEMVFNYPPVSLANSAQTSIAFVGDKAGILNKDMEFILAPDYDHISPSEMNNIYYVQKDSSWALFHVSGQLSSFYNELCEAKSMPVFQTITYKNRDTLVGFMHYNYTNGFYFLVEPKPWATLVDSVDLYALFYDLPALSESQKENSRYFWHQIQNSNQFQKELIPFNNYYIRTDFTSFVAHKLDFSQHIVQFPRISYYGGAYAGVLIPEKLKREDKVSWTDQNPHYSSEKNGTNNRKNFVYFNNGFYSEIDFETVDGLKKNSFANYILTEPKRKITFYELFKSPEKAADFFYPYLENYVNEHQLFGSTCPNFPRIYENYCSNFCFVEGGVLLKQYCPSKMDWHQSAANPTANGKDVFIPYEVLMPYLKKSIKRLGAW